MAIYSYWFEEDNLSPCRLPCKYFSEYLNRGKLKIPPADTIPMDPGDKTRKDRSDNADL